LVWHHHGQNNLWTWSTQELKEKKSPEWSFFSRRYSSTPKCWSPRLSWTSSVSIWMNSLSFVQIRFIHGFKFCQVWFKYTKLYRNMNLNQLQLGHLKNRKKCKFQGIVK
jgi:hypothetical protein